MWTIRSVRSAASVLCLLLGESLLLSGCKEDLFTTSTLTTDRQSVELLWDGTAEEKNENFGSGTGSATIKVNCLTSYTYTCDADWVQISSNQTSNSPILMISAVVNEQPTTRSALLYLTSAKNFRGEQAQQTIRITQQGIDKSTLINPSSLTLAADDTKDYTFTIKYDGNIQVSNQDAQWLEYSLRNTSYGSETKTLTVCATPNLSTTSRQGTLTLTLSRNSGSAKSTLTIPVTQYGASHGFIDENVIELSSKAVTDRLISVNYSGAWLATSDASWLKAGIKYSNGNYYLAFSVETNLSTQPREATITVSTTDLSGSQYTETISVTQLGATHGLINENVIELPSEAVTDRVVAVNYSGGWRATSDASWLKANRRYDYSGYYLALSAETNLSTQPRETTITIATTDLDGDQYSETISVTQRGGVSTDIANQITNTVLRNVLAEQCGTPGQVLQSKLETLTSLDLSAAAGQNIGSIDQILSYCPNLQHLTCKDLSLTTLNLSPLKQLQTLNCSGNRLTSLSNFPSGLTELNCSDNQLSSLNVSTLSNLTTLDCSHNNLERFSYSELGNAPVKTLDCSYNRLNAMAFRSFSYPIETFNCSNNMLSGSLSLSSLSVLKRLNCSNNNNLSFIKVNSAVLSTLEYTKDPATQIY